jgi:hypothetical protein
MKIQELIDKSKNDKTIKPVDLENLTSRSSSDDFLTGDCVLKIIEISRDGKCNTALSDKARYVIVEKCTIDVNKNITETGEAIQLYLSIFERSVQPVVEVKDEDDIVIELANNGDRVSTSGDVLPDWNKAPNIKAFFVENEGRYINCKLKDEVVVAAFDRKTNAPSLTKTRKQKMFNLDWITPSETNKARKSSAKVENEQ